MSKRPEIQAIAYVIMKVRPFVKKELTTVIGNGFCFELGWAILGVLGKIFYRFQI